MKLRSYLRLEGERPAEFAARIGASIYAVRKWLNRERIPRPKTQKIIKRATSGKVTPEDWVSDA